MIVGTACIKEADAKKLSHVWASKTEREHTTMLQFLIFRNAPTWMGYLNIVVKYIRVKKWKQWLHCSVAKIFSDTERRKSNTKQTDNESLQASPMLVLYLLLIVSWTEL